MPKNNHTSDGGSQRKATTHTDNNPDPTINDDEQMAEVLQLPSNKRESRALDEAYEEWYAEPANRKRTHEARLAPPTPISARRRSPERASTEAQHAARARRTKKNRMRPKRERIQIELRAAEAMRLAVMKGHQLSWEEAELLGRAQWEREKEEQKREPIGQLFYLSTKEADDWIRRHDHRLIAEAAINMTEAARVVDEQLAGARKRVGAPAQHTLACAVAKKLMWGDGPIVLKHAYQDFASASHPMLEWAYDSPANSRPSRRHIPSDQVISENAVRDALNGYQRKNRKTGERDRVPGILDTVDPSFFHDLLLDTSIRLAKSDLYPNMGMALSIDGTWVKARRLQENPVSERHEDLINGDMSPEECSFVHHDGKGSIRGHNALILSDPHGPVHARATKLVGAKRNEAKVATELVHEHQMRVWDRAHRDGEYPFPEEKYITGDGAFNTPKVCADLMFCFGLIPVFPWRKDMHNHTAPWAENYGVPRCDVCDGAPEMRYTGADKIPTAAERWEMGLPPGQDYREHLDLFGKDRAPRITFKCRTDGCNRTINLYIHKAPHIYAYLPYKDVHLRATTPGRKREDRHLIRRELLANRNASESLNSVLKYRCWGLEGAAAPACIKSYRQMEWITYGRFLSQALRVLVKNDGTYERAREEARNYHLDRPGLFERLKAAHHKLDDRDTSAA